MIIRTLSKLSTLGLELVSARSEFPSDYNTCDFLTWSSLAYLEMRTIIAKLVFSFDLTLAPESSNWMQGQRVFDVWEKPALNVYLKPVTHT